MPEPPLEPSPPRYPPSGGRLWIAGCLGASSAALLTILCVALFFRSGQAPKLDRERFDQAWETWQSSGQDTYRITTVVEGNQPATYSVEVAQGQVLSATRNGQPLTQPRTMGTWSVPGMFDTIEYDVNALGGDRATKGRTSDSLFLRAEFDSKTGYPAYYFRSDSATNTTTKWRVVEFTTNLESATPPSE